MAEHDEQSSGVEAAANVQPSQGRRRLVKGAIFAVPAIVTLRNASADARNSIWCVVTKFQQTQAKDENGNPVWLDPPFNNKPKLVPTDEPDPNDSCFTSLGPKAPLGKF